MKPLTELMLENIFQPLQTNKLSARGKNEKVKIDSKKYLPTTCTSVSLWLVEIIIDHYVTEKKSLIRQMAAN